MKTIILNGSPRKNWNKKAKEVAQSFKGLNGTVVKSAGRMGTDIVMSVRIIPARM